MTSVNHSNNLSFVTLHLPSSTSPPSSAASSSSASSTGWTQKITKKIQELKSKLESLNNLKEAKNNYLSEKDSKSLDSLPTQLTSLETVLKLAEFAEQLDTNKNDDSNILTNLCTGLETFLGFNSDSKGYDGTGIVYSDLDRLCDGVMGFLFKIISEVEENDNLSPYKQQLENAVNTLKQNLNKGKIGLQAVIGPVKQGIAGWLEAVKSSNENVTGPLDSLKQDVGYHILPYMEDRTIIDQLQNWRTLAGDYFGKMLASEEALYEIDINLKNKLFTEMRLIRQVVDNFEATVNDERVKISVKELHYNFIQHRSEIHERIGSQVDKVQRDVNAKFADIGSIIKNIKMTKSKQIGSIRSAVQLAQQLANTLVGERESTFEPSYNNKILQLFSSTRHAINRFLKVHDDPDNATLISDFDELEKKISVLRDSVITDLEALRKDVTEAVGKYFSRLSDGKGPESGELKEALKSEKQSKKRVGTLQYTLGMFNNNKDIVGCISKDIVNIIGNIFPRNMDHGFIELNFENDMQNVYKTHCDIQECRKKINAHLSELQRLPGTINDKRMSAEALMKDLKQQMQGILKKIESINKPVNDAEDAFDSAISDIEGSLLIAQSAANGALPLLKSDLQIEVRNALNDLEDGVKKMFDAQKKSELKALHASLSNGILNMKSIIDIDFDAGRKGLMKRLKAVFAHLLNPNKELKLYANRVKDFYKGFFDHLEDQQDILPDQGKLTPLAGALSALLSTMNTQRHFSSTVSSKLSDLHAALNTLTPSGFADASPLLNVVKAGVQAFHGELAKQYVSRYSGKTIEWLKPLTAKNTQEPTTDAINCARVFLTAIHILAELMEFNEKCMSPALCKKRIFKRNEDTTLAKYLQNYGYGIPSSTETQDGELRRGLTGMIIGTFLTEEKNGHKLFTYLGKPDGTIAKLYGYLHLYYQVRHLATLSSKKHPSSVYDMLRWLTAFPHNTVFSRVSVSDIADLFEKPEETASNESHVDDLPVLLKDPDTLDAYPGPIAASTLTNTLRDLCTHAEDVLIGILGHGHADGIYAVDFNTNPDGFSYPTAPGACFDMLCDVLNRLYQQLFFLYGQCSNEEPSVSWRDCWYGNQVGGSAWNCNTMQCPNQKGNQIHKQTCNQNCNQIAQCGIKSPLQSFLEDGLPGFLPHSFTKPGCKLECTYSNHRGIPCRTPMGFADISVTASHRQTGAYLKKVLEDFCGSESAPLTKLCAQLNCLLQKPPQALGDIFAFYYGYLEEWANDFYNKPRKPNPYTQVAFNDAVNAAIFGKPYDALNPKILVSSGKHDHTHTKGDLFTIADCTSGSVAPCGLYVKSVTQEIFNYYSSEHKGNHLSWFVYITETFYDLLKKLYDDCCNKCGPTGSKCYTKSCDEKCSVKYTTDKTEQVSAVSTEHQPTCKSIVTCRDTHPTLYKYGFTFGNTIVLNGSRGNRGAKRTCNDFCEALKKMLDKESVIITLRKQIDEFLWQIRLNFSITVLALWLLSLLYLIHIMVIRLDLLHIKSHLHSPSSHRIAAQSLLAAARVNKPGRVFYLQP